MARKPLTVQELLTRLGAAPSRIADAVGDARPARLRARPGPDEWSAVEVLAHLRVCADVWGGCIDTILVADEPTIRAVNPRRWISTTGYAEEDFEDSLRAFTTQRVELLAVLQALAPGDWSRRAIVTGAGRPLVRTVHDYAQWLARHEQPHIEQIRRSVGAFTS